MADHHLFRNSKIVAGTIDGIDAFWATHGQRSDIIVGSASTTGALRRWRHTRKEKYDSRMIQSIHVSKDAWIELIPFNNVGTSFDWLATNFKNFYEGYLTDTNQLNIDMLEEEIKLFLPQIKGSFHSYIRSLPLFFPYIEGEPRGPQGRRNITGGFIQGNLTSLKPLDLYMSLILGISFMFRHNFEVLVSNDNSKEIRLTGMIARKSPFFLSILATLTNLKVRIMKKEQSVAWATAMRSLMYLKTIEELPTIEMFDPVKPLIGESSKALNELYSLYLKVYINPKHFDKISSEEELLEG